MDSLRFPILFIVFLSSLLLWGCTKNAPRDNPFDPNSDVYQYAETVRGTIHRKIQPYAPIQGALIETIDRRYSTESKADGSFEIDRLPDDSVTLYISKDGFGDQQITLAAGSEPVDLYLNAKPRIDSIQLTTNHQSHWWPVEDEYAVTIDAWIGDADGLGDVDSVVFWFENPAIHLDVEQPFPADGHIQTAFHDWQLQSAITDLIGKPLHGYSTDIDLLTSDSIQTFISRFIEASPVPLSPINDSEVGPRPTLRWDYFDASFTFFYHIEIFRITSGNTFTQVFTKDEIPQNITEYTVTDSLQSGSYYWTLGVIDALGNSTHSKEATFTVTQ